MKKDIQNNGTSKSLHTVTEMAGMNKCLYITRDTAKYYAL